MAPARQVHLEEAVLRVRESGREGEIGAVFRGDGGNAERVAHDADRRRDARRSLTFDTGQRRAQQQVNGKPRCNDEQQKTDRNARDEFQSSATFKISIEFVPPSTPDSSPFVRIT
jgi:hypothetical protein